MSEDTVEIGQQAFQKSTSPLALREFGEIPKDYVSVFSFVRQEDLSRLAERGFKPEDNAMDRRAKVSAGDSGESIEDLFDKERQRQGIEIDRGECLFAFPDREAAGENYYGFNEEEYQLVEIKVDPAEARVAWGEYFSKANQWLMVSKEGPTQNTTVNPVFIKNQRENTLNNIRQYWEESVTLRQYLDGDHELPEDMAEVLVPGEISTDRIRVV